MEMNHRELAKTSFNHCWDLLEAPERSEEDQRNLVGAAMTSRFHWRLAGGLQEWIIADWMVARAAGSAHFGAVAVQFALAAEGARTDELPDWLHASTAEGVARAYRDAGDLERMNEWLEVARRRIEDISDPDDAALIASQVAEL